MLKATAISTTQDPFAAAASEGVPSLSQEKVSLNVQGLLDALSTVIFTDPQDFQGLP
jgi:hypothetical protein